MDAILQIIITGLTLGAMYALASVGLALTYGTMGMFNMAHGVFMTVGAYSAYAAVEYMGLPLPIAFVAGLAAGAVIGAVMHLFVVRHMLKTDGFEINIIVATAGVAILSEDLILKIFGAYPFRQPLQLDGTFRVGGLAVTYQSIAILAVAAALVGMMAWILTKTRFGLAIRATAINREAAMLMGVKADQM